MLHLLYFKLIYMNFCLIFYFLVQNSTKSSNLFYLLSRQTTHSTLVETTKGIFLTFFDRSKLPKVYLLYHGFKNINRHLLKKLQFFFLFSNLTFIPIYFKILTERQKTANSVIRFNKFFCDFVIL